MLALLFAEEVEEVRAFDTAWDIVKMAWRVYNPQRTRQVPHPWYILNRDIYSGGDSDQWTPVLEEALGYALFGSAVPMRKTPFSHDRFKTGAMPMKAGVPKIRVARDDQKSRDSPILHRDTSMTHPAYAIGEPDNAEMMPDDELRNLIESLMADKKHRYSVDGRKVGDTRTMWRENTSAYGNTDEDIEEHMRNALQRLESGVDETDPLPQELMSIVGTSQTEPVKRYSSQELNDLWNQYREQKGWKK